MAPVESKNRDLRNLPSRRIMNAETARLIELYNRDGKLTAETVLDDARSADSPFHHAIEWDDAIAAHEHRLEQARQIVRRADVTILEKQVRRFVFLSSTASYQPIETIALRSDWRAEMVAEFQRDAARFEARWANHQHVAEHYRQWRTQTL